MAMPIKYPITEEIQEAMQHLYTGSSRSITVLSEQFGVPRSAVRSWALRLGIAKPFAWRDEEIKYLENRISHDRVEDIAKHLGRTVVSLKHKAWELGISKRDTQGYTVKSLSDAFGISHQIIERWITQGYLMAHRRKTAKHGCDFWYISDKAVREFILKYPLEIEKCQATMDILWFIDVLGGGEKGLGSLSTMTKEETNTSLFPEQEAAS